MSIFRGRNRVAIAVAVVVGLLVLGVGVRYFVLRADRQSTESSVEHLTRTTNQALALLRRVTSSREGVDADNDTTTGERDRTRAAAALLHAELDKARAETTSSSVEAFTSGARANDIGACLVGVSQALNQLSVGDNGAIGSLQRVEAPCRAARLAT